MREAAPRCPWSVWAWVTTISLISAKDNPCRASTRPILCSDPGDAGIHQDAALRASDQVRVDHSER